MILFISSKLQVKEKPREKKLSSPFDFRKKTRFSDKNEAFLLAKFKAKNDWIHCWKVLTCSCIISLIVIKVTLDKVLILCD